MPSSPKGKRKQAPRKKEYTQQEKNNDLRNSLFKSISGMIGGGAGSLLGTPVMTTAVDESRILHEIEGIKLYLFDFIKRFDEIKEQLIQIKWELYRLNHPEGTFIPNDWIKPHEYTHTPPQPPPSHHRDSIYKGPNKDKGQDFVRKNIAQILKNMIPKHYMEQMPPEVRDAYHNILSVMAPPNDPIWDKDQGQQKKIDPREPWSYTDVAQYWNNIAEGTKKIDDLGADIIGEAVKGATEMLKDKEEEEEANAFGLDDQEKLLSDKYKKEDKERKMKEDESKEESKEES